MPTYVYEHCDCPDPVTEQFDKDYPNAHRFETFELNVPIEQRDLVKCGHGKFLKRRIVFNGLTWAPTAGGMR